MDDRTVKVRPLAQGFLLRRCAKARAPQQDSHLRWPQT
ncbi:hypothetical protein XCR_2663 [Xanthomonas campestris pv. raphani 756C]|nr:hypothetical protein XCR_2663 [Xanthomonas campestris pv. raphani 756C]